MNEIFFYVLGSILIGIIGFIGSYFRLCICSNHNIRDVYILVFLYFLMMIVLGIKKFLFDSWYLWKNFIKVSPTNCDLSEIPLLLQIANFPLFSERFCSNFFKKTCKDQRKFSVFFLIFAVLRKRIFEIGIQSKISKNAIQTNLTDGYFCLTLTIFGDFHLQKVAKIAEFFRFQRKILQFFLWILDF